MKEEIKAFEIYVKNPETGELGWDIVFVWSTEKLIVTYPHFDCIITRNDWLCGGFGRWL